MEHHYFAAQVGQEKATNVQLVRFADIFLQNRPIALKPVV